MNFLNLINSPEGKQLLSKLGHTPQGKIVFINHHSYYEHVKGNTFRGVFFSGSAIEKLFGLYRKENPFPIHQLRFLTSPATFNPAAGSVSPVDGMARVVGVNESFTLIRADSGTQAFDSLTSIEACLLTATATSNQYGTMSRGFFYFDTSGLTGSAVVSAATFSLFVTAKSDTLGSAASVAMVQANSASNSTIGNADYQGTVNNTTLQASSVAISGISTSAYLDMALNAAGLSNISKTTISQFGMKMEVDRANSTPTWASGGSGSITVNYADNGTNIPKLVVTFTISTGASFLNNFM